MGWLRHFRESTVRRPAKKVVGILRGLFYFLVGVLTQLAVWLDPRGWKQKTAQKRDNFERILLIRPDQIGDVILPAFGAVRKAFPAARIAAVVKSSNEELLRDDPSVDELILVEGDQLGELWRCRKELARVKEETFDLAIAFDASWACGLLAYMSRAGHRLGWDFRGARAFFTHPVPFPFLEKKVHELQANLNLVGELGISVIHELPRVRISDEARKWACEWWHQHECPQNAVRVLIHPGSRSAYTRWDPKRFAEVAKRLSELENALLFFLEGPGEEKLIEDVTGRMQISPRVVKGLSLGQLAAFLESTHLFIGNATGTTHVAAYVGPSVIEIIGGTHPLDCPERWGVLGERHRIVSPKSSAAKAQSDTWVGPEGLDQISVEDIWQAIEEVWPDCVSKAGENFS